MIWPWSSHASYPPHRVSLTWAIPLVVPDSRAPLALEGCNSRPHEDPEDIPRGSGARDHEASNGHAQWSQMIGFLTRLDPQRPPGRREPCLVSRGQTRQEPQRQTSNGDGVRPEFATAIRQRGRQSVSAPGLQTGSNRGLGVGQRVLKSHRRRCPGPKASRGPALRQPLQPPSQ